jgi:hypothetical protein
MPRDRRYLAFQGAQIAGPFGGNQPALSGIVRRPASIQNNLPGELLQSRLGMLGPALPESKFLVLSRAQFEMAGATMLDLGTESGRDYLDQVIERCHITLIILDSVSTLVRSGIDNDVESWRAIQDWSLRHRARGRAVIYPPRTFRPAARYLVARDCARCPDQAHARR